MMQGNEGFKCPRCKHEVTKEGHDFCLGTLNGGVMNACCGHGDDDMAYVQFWNAPRLGGQDALDWIEKYKRIVPKENINE